jgi:hypothetical protein
VLITGGGDSNSPGGIASAEIFHAATGVFEPLAPMHSARIEQTTTVLRDGRVLIAGGRGDSVTASAEIFDPATKKFTVTVPCWSPATSTPRDCSPTAAYLSPAVQTIVIGAAR